MGIFRKKKEIVLKTYGFHHDQYPEEKTLQNYLADTTAMEFSIPEDILEEILRDEFDGVSVEEFLGNANFDDTELVYYLGKDYEAVKPLQMAV